MSNTLSISDQLTKLDPDRALLPSKPSWHENERNMRITGIALIAIGAVGAALSVAAIAFGAMGVSLGALPAGGLIGVGVGGIALSIAAIAKGIFLLNKSYWNDQSYVDKQSFQAMKMSFDDIVKTYDWEHINSGNLLSNKALKAKFFEKIEHMEYASIIEQHRQQILEHKFISFKELKPKLILEAKNLTDRSFKEKYGDQPLVDAVLGKEDAFYVAMIRRAIASLPYHTICQDYAVELSKNIISKEDITAVISDQCAGKSFSTIFEAQGKDHFWQIIQDQILPPEHFKELVLQEELTVAELLERFGWNLFTLRILQGRDVRQKLLIEIKDLSFSQIIERYSWKAVDEALLLQKDLTPLAAAECEQIRTFEEIYTRFGENVFKKHILSSKDLIIQSRIKDLCQRMAFCTMIDSYKDILIPYNLLPYNVDELIKEKEATDQRLKTRKTNAERAATESAKAAFTAKDANISSSLKLKQSARKAINAENIAHTQHAARIQGQIDQEDQAHRNTLYELKKQNPAANCDAEHHRHMAAKRSLELTKLQEESRHRMQISYLINNKQTTSRIHKEQVAAQEAAYKKLILQAELTKKEQIATATELHALELRAVDAKFKELIG